MLAKDYWTTTVKETTEPSQKLNFLHLQWEQISLGLGTEIMKYKEMDWCIVHFGQS